MNPTRYIRQTIFPGIGEAGQQKLLAAKVVVLGCGATGTVIANHLARAGIGELVIVDRDFIELSNLQRQTLFDETDLAAALPKAIAAERKLRAVNSDLKIHGIVADINPDTIEDLILGATLVMDGTDNFETRYLINDACLKHHLPWIYTGVVGGYGTTQTIIPNQTACLRCLMPNIPPPGTSATCETAGVVGPVVGVVASLSATEAIKLLVDQGEKNKGLIHLDLWDLSFEQMQLGGPRPDCVACSQHRYDFLDETQRIGSTSLCGRNAVQVRVSSKPLLDLQTVAQTLAAVATIQIINDYLLRFTLEPEAISAQIEITLFRDARAIIKGTDDEILAKSLYAKYIGS